MAINLFSCNHTYPKSIKFTSQKNMDKKLERRKL